MEWTTLFDIALGAILINNFILAQFLGICPFMGVSKKMDTAVGMGFAVIFVMGLAAALRVGELQTLPDAGEQDDRQQEARAAGDAAASARAWATRWS